MFKRFRWVLVFSLLLSFINKAYSQQDLDFHINAHLLSGKKILKLKRNFTDPFLWVLAQNNEVYRINSVNQEVVNYTAKFATYSTLEFIDIAGYTADVVFVATRSNKVIELNNSALTTISVNDNSTDIVTSIGVSILSDGIKKLLIATINGQGYYDYVSNELFFLEYTNKNIQPINIWTATYRTTMYPDPYPRFDAPEYYPLFYTSPFSTYGDNITHTIESGSKFNTMYYTLSGITYPSNYGGSLFWGNDNGLFQEPMLFPFPRSFASFLKDTKVNKIADIFGLASFFDPFNVISKDNLLIGTEKGLYFSNSLLNKMENSLEVFDLYHFDAMGNTPVYDICVNNTGLDPVNNCEDGVWLATANGVYLIKPDYLKYLDPNLWVGALYTDKDFTNYLSTVDLCGATSIKLNVNRARAGKNNLVQWMKDGQEITGQISDELTVSSMGEYYALIYSACDNVHIQTNHLKITKSAGPVFSFNYSDKIQQCNNSPYTLQTENNPAYQFRWYTNGVLNGAATASFVATQCGKYKVEVSACPNSWVSSKEVEVEMVTLPVPLTTTDKSTHCAGDIATLNANIPVDVAGYTINWYRDGILLPNNTNFNIIKETLPGSYTITIKSNTSECFENAVPYSLNFTPAPVFTSTFPAELRSCTAVPLNVTFAVNAIYNYRWYTNGVLNGATTDKFLAIQTGKYRVEASTCDGSWVSSNEIQVYVNDAPVPVITKNKAAYCAGDNAILTTNTPLSPVYTVNWYRDNVLIADNSNQTFLMTAVAGTYKVIITTNTANSDGTICSQTSAENNVVFDTPPTLSVASTAGTSICEGGEVYLTATYSGGTIKWSTGEKTNRIRVSAAGHYKASVTTAAGCEVEAGIDIKSLPSPVLNVADATLCTYKQEATTITAPAGFTSYKWNGITGGQTYKVSQPQVISLSVTDENGCEATQQIKITSQCPDIWIPNTFTPNNDGVNDTWKIEGIDNDKTATVKIYNRLGAQVLNIAGSSIPWNGEFKGKKLPAGVYYFIVTAKNGTQRLSGSVTIIY